MECSRTWVSERTQWSYCDRWGSKKKMFSFLNKCFHWPGCFKIAASDVPSARPPPLFSSCWKWPETGLWGQSPVALPERLNKRGQISWNNNKIKVNRVPTFKYVCVCHLVCCLDGEELMLPFCAAHVSEGPVVCYISGDEGDLVYRVLVLNHLTDRGGVFLSRKSIALGGWKAQQQNSLLISRPRFWCPTWKCWPRSSACVCLGTGQQRPYPGARK